MRRIFLILGVTLFAMVTPAPAQRAYTADLREWTSRAGRMLHGYYAAHGVAVAAVRERSGGRELPPLYAGGPYDDGWAFSFGSLEGDSAFVIRYGVIVTGSGTVAQFNEFPGRRVASPYHTLAARALARVQDDFQRIRTEQRFTAQEYRFAVLPFPRGELTAFVSPAQTRPGVTLAGSDMMVSLARDDVRILDRTRFHHRVIELPTVPPPNAEGAALIVPDAPAPSPVDVLHAMERKAPLFVLANRGAYLIGPDGSIEVLPEDDPRSRALRAHGGP
jgi:hypothetical protein